MKVRRLGRTGLEVSRLAFGGGYVGGIVVLKDDDTRRRAVRRAVDAGINWFDTAPHYGQGRSEEALGRLLAELNRQPFVSTKVGLDLERLDDVAGQVERSVHASLERLRRERVDLLQLHNRIAAARGSGPLGAVPIDTVLADGGIADALDAMREQGLARFVGLTALGEAPAIVRAIDSGRFDTAQVYYNMLNPSAARAMPAAWTGHGFGGVLDACRRHDVGVMGIRIFASGVLASDVRSGREAVLTEASDLEVESARARAAFAALGPLQGTRAQTALRFGLASPDLDCIVIGMAELAHLEEAIEAERAGPLDAHTVARLEKAYAAGFAAG